MLEIHYIKVFLQVLNYFNKINPKFQNANSADTLFKFALPSGLAWWLWRWAEHHLLLHPPTRDFYLPHTGGFYPLPQGVCTPPPTGVSTPPPPTGGGGGVGVDAPRLPAAERKHRWCFQEVNKFLVKYTRCFISKYECGAGF